MPKSEFEQAIEQGTGLTVEQIRHMAPEDLRQLRERQFGKPMRFIGAGLIRLITHEEIEREVDKALRTV